MYVYEVWRDDVLVVVFEASSDDGALRRASVEGFSVLAVAGPSGPFEASRLEVA